MEAFASQAAGLLADETVRRLLIMSGTGMGLGALLIGLFAAFPAKKPGPNYSRVLEFGVYSDIEHNDLQRQRAAEQDEQIKRVKEALLGPEPTPKAGSGTQAPGPGHVSTDATSSGSKLRRRAAARAQQSKRATRATSDSDDGRGSSSELDTSREAGRSRNDGDDTDEEDMNPNLSREQRALQKALLGTRSRAKLKVMLDEAEHKARNGERGMSRRTVTRSLDCLVYVVLIGLLVYAMQVEYGLDVPQFLSWVFPTEAAVLAGRTTGPPEGQSGPMVF